MHRNIFEGNVTVFYVLDKSIYKNNSKSLFNI